MKQVDFYLISNGVVDAKYKLASRLANKIQRMKQSALVVTDSKQESLDLDQVMWSFSDTSFLAHELISDDNSHATILVAEKAAVSAKALEKNYDVLINLSQEVPVLGHSFTRIAEVVGPDEGSKAEARARYKSYQADGFSLKTHKIEL